MIRKLQKKDIDKMAAIWLAANLQAHNFISSQYWQNNFAAVQAMLAKAEVYVYVDEAGIQSFIGLATVITLGMQRYEPPFHNNPQKNTVQFYCTVFYLNCVSAPQVFLLARSPMLLLFNSSILFQNNTGQLTDHF